MKIVVLDINYPSETNLYGDVFVHARVQGYVAEGHNVHVIAFFTRGTDYTFEGIAVTSVSTLETLLKTIRQIAPDVVAIHFFQGWMLRKLVLELSSPIAVWVHGMEALGWYRRLFDVPSLRRLPKHVAANVLQIARMRDLYEYVRQNSDRAALVFVSKWMRDSAAADALTDIQPYHLIPNPIDTALFTYEHKAVALRSRILLIRSFDSRKYANDVAVKAILALRSREGFEEFRFTIVGKGRYFAKLTEPLRGMPNVTLKNTFVDRAEMRELHAHHGVFLCPTRQDAQGVSMCEAMASGLVPVTSQSTAIPEFVTHGESGYLCANSESIADAMYELWQSPERFERMSAAAAAAIDAKAAAKTVISREITMMMGLANR